MKARVIQTLPSKMLGVFRIVLGTTIILAGASKMLINDVHQAWSTQLTEINLAYCIIFLWATPLLEILAGSALTIGYLSRLAAFFLIPVMTVAIYVYLTVSNQAAFLMPPYEAALPPLIIMIATVIVIYGGGSWSIDLKNSNRN